MCFTLQGKAKKYKRLPFCPAHFQRVLYLLHNQDKDLFLSLRPSVHGLVHRTSHVYKVDLTLTNFIYLVVVSNLTGVRAFPWEL